MAKVTGPLMSLGARGQLGKTIVMSVWKGIKTARQYVTPANPRTAGQVAQRSAWTTLTQFWAANMSAALLKTAWNRSAALLSAPMSGFNAFMRAIVEQYNDPAVTAIPIATAVAVNSTNIDVTFTACKGSNGTTGVQFWAGATPGKLSLVSANNISADIASEVTADLLTYFQVRLDDGVTPISGVIKTADVV